MTHRDPQYLFGKISTSLIHRVSIQRTSRIFITSYALSKRPHLHRAYVKGGCIFFATAVLLVGSDFLNCLGIGLHDHVLTSPNSSMTWCVIKLGTEFFKFLGQKLVSLYFSCGNYLLNYPSYYHNCFFLILQLTIFSRFTFYLMSMLILTLI